MNLTVGEPPVHPAPLLDGTIDAGRRNMANGWYGKRCAFLEQAPIPRKRERQRVHTQCRRRVADAAGLAEVIADDPRRGEDDDAVIRLGTHQGHIILDETLPDRPKPLLP